MTSLETLIQENTDLHFLLEEQNGKLDRAIFAIYQLHSGLYNPKTQCNTLDKVNTLLFGQPGPLKRANAEVAKEAEEADADTEDADPEEHMPTTRQGDEHERRIQHLEQTICQLDEKVKILEKILEKKYF